jgi:hypothetical protein
MEPLDPVLVRKLSKTQQDYIGSSYKKMSINEIDMSKMINLKKFVGTAHHPDSFMSRWKDRADYKLTLHILKSINEASGFNLDDLRVPHKRYHSMAVARSIFTYLERTLNKRSFPDIASLLNKDHTSCMYMLKSFSRYEAESEAFAKYMENEKIRRLVDAAKKGVWSWEWDHNNQRKEA